MTLNTHFHLVKMLRITGVIPPSLLYTFMMWTWTVSHLTFIYSSLFICVFSCFIPYLFIYLFGGRDCVVGVAPCYGLDGPSIEPQ
jgi:hypothetical protein